MSSSTQSQPKHASLLSYLTQEAVGGLSAGILGTVIGFPLDTVKARQQQAVRATPLAETASASAGIVSTARRIVQTEGALALYRGIVPPLLSLSLLNTLNFTSYSYVQRTIHARQSNWDYRNAIAGGCCGPLASTISTVENLIKTQVQLDNVSARRYQGSYDCLQQLAASTSQNGRFAGISILYTGHTVNTIREVVFLMTYFGMYEGLRGMWVHAVGTSSDIGSTNNDVANHPLAIPIAGGFAGAIAWSVSFPLDCVRAGVQGQDLIANSHRETAWSVLTELLHTRGIRGLYAGVAPSIVRAFLVSGSRFTAYEAALWLLRGGRDATAATV